MPFLRNCWYVAGWSDEIGEPRSLLGRVIIGDPVVVWRGDDGIARAMADRCPHRHAPLSFGRVDGTTLQCGYHGMTFGADGRCIGMPLLDTPPAVALRTYPVVERDDWIWVWMGDPERADPALVPVAFGIRNAGAPMRNSAIEYDAHYQLIHDNLCDLSHLDFTHDTTLGPASGTSWAITAPRVTQRERGILIERWFENALLPGGDGSEHVDTYASYRFEAPGIFIMRTGRYPIGTARACDHGDPGETPALSQNIEQQAVTPIDERRTTYFFATGVVARPDSRALDVDTRMGIVLAAFDEDRRMIEGQQRILDRTPADETMLFVPQDKAPFMMRRLMARLMREERADAAPA